ncbi:hypothetical protein MGH68_02590 [Erysipelothrix sp. D19-032]
MFLAAYLSFNIDKLESYTDAVNEVVRVGKHIESDRFQIVKDTVDSFDFDRIVYLGDADLNGFAQESALKMLELTLVKQ